MPQTLWQKPRKLMHDALRRDFVVNGVINMTDDWGLDSVRCGRSNTTIVAAGFSLLSWWFADERGAPRVAVNGISAILRQR